MTPEYAAGFFDGEGCVSIGANSEDSSMFVRVKVVNTVESVILEFRQLFGGTTHSRGPSKKGHKTQYIWQAVGIDAQRFLETVQPFTIVKAEQVELALEFFAFRALPREARHHLLPSKQGRNVWQKTPQTRQFEVDLKRKMNVLNFRSSSRLRQKTVADLKSMQLLQGSAGLV